MTSMTFFTLSKPSYSVKVTNGTKIASLGRYDQPQDEAIDRERYSYTMPFPPR